MPTGTVSSTQEVQRTNKYSTRGGKLTHDKNIAGNVDYAFVRDNISTIKYNLQISSEKVFPKKTVSKERTLSKEDYQTGDNETKYEIDTLNENTTLDILVYWCLLKRIVQENVVSRQIASNPKLLLAKDMDKIFDPSIHNTY